MDFLARVFTPEQWWAITLTPVLLALLPLINRSEKERNRKGLHPLTKWSIGAFLLFLAFTAGIAIGRL